MSQQGQSGQPYLGNNQPNYPPGYPPPGYYRPPKDKTWGYLLEIIIPGLGWIYSGNTNTGVPLLIGMVVWNIIAGIIDTVTAGVFLCVDIPVDIIVIVISVTKLTEYMKTRTDLFGNI